MTSLPLSRLRELRDLASAVVNNPMSVEYGPQDEIDMETALNMLIVYVTAKSIGDARAA
jgi:hypothetical protein